MTTAREQIRVSREWLDLVKNCPRAVASSSSAQRIGQDDTVSMVAVAVPETSQPVLAIAIRPVSGGAPGVCGLAFAGSSDYRFHFVGDTTPATAPAMALAATWRAVAEARWPEARWFFGHKRLRRRARRLRTQERGHWSCWPRRGPS